MLLTSGSRSKIVKQSDGTFSIDNKKNGNSISDFGGDLGVMTSSLITPTDIMSVDREKGAEMATLRDGSEVDLTPKGGTAPSPGRVPKGEIWVKVGTKAIQKGGTFIKKAAKYFKFTKKAPKTDFSKIKTTVGKELPKKAPENIWRERLEALSRLLNGLD